MRPVLWIWILLVFTTIGVLAQGFEPGRQYQLQSLGEWQGEGQRRCGDYFALFGQAQYPNGKYGVVAFHFQSPKGNEFLIVGWDKFITVADESKRVPTAEYARTPNGPVPFTWTIRINAKDLKQASPCIPGPRGHEKGERRRL